MKGNSYPWSEFALLWVAGMLTVPLSYPFLIALGKALGEDMPFSWGAVLRDLLFVAVLLLVAVGLGLALSRRIGLRAPFVEAWLYGKTPSHPFASVVACSIAAGTAAPLVDIALDAWLFVDRLHILEPAYEIHSRISGIAAWIGLLASFYGGICEELVFRFFLMSLFAWLCAKLVRGDNGMPRPIAFWVANVASSVLFGFYHLGGAEPAMIAARTILFILIPGVTFGILYWKRGLEAAVIAHFTTDVVVHVIRPILQ